MGSLGVTNPAAWKTRLRLHVGIAYDNLRYTDMLFDLAEAFFRTPIPPAVAQDPVALAAAERTKLDLSLRTLTAATQNLCNVLLCIKTSRVLEQIGGSIQQVEPWVPAAMGRLRDAGDYAVDAMDAVERCRACLSTAIALLDGGLNVGVSVQRERRSAFRALKDAMERELDAFVQVSATQQMLAAWD